MSAVRERIEAMYGSRVLRRSAMNIRGGAGVFERVLAGKGYRTAVEIGTYRGVSTAEIAQYVEHVVTFDLREGKLENSGETFDRRALWDALGVGHKITLILVRDNAEKAAILRGMKFDFAFVDGAHDETVRDDFDMVKKCGRVLFHDADDNRLREHKANAPNHVYDFLATLPKDQVEFIDIFALWQAPA